MNVFTAITTRRSIRKFLDRPVSQATIRELLGYAVYAPSAGDARPWHFVVVTDRATIQELGREHPFSDASTTAPCALVVCGDLDKETHAGFWVQDCAACAQTILLAAHAMGLGACWTGIFPIKSRVHAVADILGLPSRVLPAAVIYLGHTDQRTSLPPARQVGPVVSYERFGISFPPAD